MKMILVLALFASPAMAAPVHLECRLTSGDGIMPNAVFDVTLNESEGKVDYTITGGSNPPVAEKVAGVFTAKSVQFGSFTIDRIDLGFTRKVTYLDPPMISQGKCKLVTMKRAF